MIFIQRLKVRPIAGSQDAYRFKVAWVNLYAIVESEMEAGAAMLEHAEQSGWEILEFLQGGYLPPGEMPKSEEVRKHLETHKTCGRVYQVEPPDDVGFSKS